MLAYWMCLAFWQVRGLLVALLEKSRSGRAYCVSLKNDDRGLFGNAMPDRSDGSINLIASL